MYRHFGVLLQLRTLRRAIKQVYGIKPVSFVCKPPHNIGEETITPVRGVFRKETMQHVFVLSHDKQPLDPCHPARARKLLTLGKAAVYRWYPFTIILRERMADSSRSQSHRLKIDPGSKFSGVAIVSEKDNSVIWAGEIEHRGKMIRDALYTRSGVRRFRRLRKCRHRPSRHLNRRTPLGTLMPSIKSRVDNIAHYAMKLLRLCPVTSLSMELAKFDVQKMHAPEISGVEYQQGELQGYEVREYLLEKWNRECVYCGKRGVPLEIEHITPKSRGGTNRVSNLTLACHDCNQAKGTKTAAEFGHPKIQARAGQSLKDAAVMNATRNAIFRRLSALGLPLEVGTGAMTKMNRVTQGFPKKHWVDAACVGVSGGNVLLNHQQQFLHIVAMGRGHRRVVTVNKYGFPSARPKRSKRMLGFMTGDFVVAVVPQGKYKGKHVGRVAVRNRGTFRVGRTDGISWKHCRIVQYTDGFDCILSAALVKGGQG